MARPNRSKPLSTFVYRNLAFRLALAGVILALIFAALAYVTQLKEIGETAIADARGRLDLLLYRAGEVASRDNIPPDQAFQKILTEGLPARHRPTDGTFVYGRFYNLEGTLKGAFKRTGYPRIVSVLREIASQPPRLPPDQEVWQDTIRIDNTPYIHFVTAITNAENKTLGYGDIVFAVSPEAVSKARRQILKTVLYVLLIILAATALLYPVILSLTRRLARYSETLLSSNLETLSVVGNAIAKRDSDTDAHNYRVTIYAVRMAEALGMDSHEVQRLIKGAFLHDVGKIGIRDDILLKPGRLDDEEFQVMKAHVKHGGEIVHRSKWLQDSEDVVNYHHEKYDGSGYPSGLAKEQIPLAARIFALVDVFDALTSKRPYKAPLSFEKTMQILQEGRGGHFDPQLHDLFAGMAKELYDTFCQRDDEVLHKSLETILKRYFKAGMETLTY